MARAWVDPDFKARLLADGRAACEELGISFYDDTSLIVLENTDAVHNLIVCTLLLLSAAGAGAPAGLVQAEALPAARGIGAAGGPG